MNEEHRKDYPDLLARITKIEAQTNGGLKAQFQDVKDYIGKWIEKHDSDAKEFRSEIRADLKELSKLMSERPCVIHTEEIKNIKNVHSTQKAFLLVAFTAIIAGLVGYGMLKNQVDVNTQRWNNYIDGKVVK